MATVIDSLVMTLGLDNKPFKKYMKESAKIQDDFEKKSDDHQKKQEASDKKVEREKERRHHEEVKQHKETLENFKKMREQLITFLLVFTAGKEIGEFISETIRSSVEIGHLSENVDMAVESVAGWQYAMKSIGGTAEGASGSISKAAEAVASFHAGMQNNQVSGLFSAAGGTGVNLKGAFRDTQSLLLAQADVVHALFVRNPKDAMLKARQMMGIDPETFNLLKEGREEVEKKVRQGASISGINKAQTEEAAEAMRNWTELMTHLASVGRSILFPILKELGHWMSTHREEISKMIESVKEAVAKFTPEAAERIAAAFTTIVESLKAAIQLMKDLHAISEKLGLTGDQASKPQGVMEKSVSNAFTLLKIPQMLLMGGIEKYGNRESSGATTIGNVNIYSQTDNPLGHAKEFMKAIHSPSTSMVRQANTP